MRSILRVTLGLIWAFLSYLMAQESMLGATLMLIIGLYLLLASEGVKEEDK